MTEKKSVGFLLERGQKEILDELTNEEAGIIFKAIYEYETTGEIPKLEKSLKIVFKQFKIKLDYYDGRYNKICERNRKNIQNYWDKIRNTTEYDRIQSNTMATNKIKEKKSKVKKSKDKESEREINKERDAAASSTPTLSEIVSYGKELGLDEEYCERFFDNYEGTGWINGTGNQIKNWKAVLRNWKKKDVSKGNIKDKNKIDVDKVYEDDEGKLYKMNYDGTRYYI